MCYPARQKNNLQETTHMSTAAIELLYQSATTHIKEGSEALAIDSLMAAEYKFRFYLRKSFHESPKAIEKKVNFSFRHVLKVCLALSQCKKYVDLSKECEIALQSENRFGDELNIFISTFLVKINNQLSTNKNENIHDECLFALSAAAHIQHSYLPTVTSTDSLMIAVQHIAECDDHNDIRLRCKFSYNILAILAVNFDNADYQQALLMSKKIKEKMVDDYVLHLYFCTELFLNRKINLEDNLDDVLLGKRIDEQLVVEIEDATNNFAYDLPDSATFVEFFLQSYVEELRNKNEININEIIR